jgi:hypothetical protein
MQLTLPTPIPQPEVESVLENAVLTVLGNSPEPQRRTALMNKMIEALEHDSAWVELYGITGELRPSEAAFKGNEEGEKDELLLQVKEVRTDFGYFGHFLNKITPGSISAQTPGHSTREVARNQNPGGCTVYERMPPI